MDTLEALHVNGCIHGDICDDNIMINHTVKVIDFGAAVFLENSEKRSVIIRPGYSPPEQYERRGILGAWTDLYALGGMMYKAVTGVRPVEAINRLNGEQLKAPSEINPFISRKFERIIMKALELDQKRRYQAVKEFRKDLIRNSFWKKLF